MVRSALSVIAGIAVLTITSFAIEAALAPFVGALPGPWLKTLTFVYGVLCVAAGGYVAARLARRRPVEHAAAMGILQSGLTILAMFSTVANHASPSQWIAIAILSVPAALAGGIMVKRTKANEGLEKTPLSA